VNSVIDAPSGTAKRKAGTIMAAANFNIDSVLSGDDTTAVPKQRKTAGVRTGLGAHMETDEQEMQTDQHMQIDSGVDTAATSTTFAHSIATGEDVSDGRSVPVVRVSTKKRVASTPTMN
jgi:hypothetical protein